MKEQQSRLDPAEPTWETFWRSGSLKVLTALRSYIGGIESTTTVGRAAEQARSSRAYGWISDLRLLTGPSVRALKLPFPKLLPELTDLLCILNEIVFPFWQEVHSLISPYSKESSSPAAQEEFWNLSRSQLGKPVRTCPAGLQCLKIDRNNTYKSPAI
jgi:hypothetical protein